ncbi:MAG: tyrosine-type recombinase/integrase [Verrucomicrobiales bacterium]|nr:tyrosine-type recombinase/integrase [Verrucomicrobiales bacterium]
MLKAARRDGHVKPPLPYEGIEWQKVDNKARRLYTAGEADQLYERVLQASKNGRQVVDYLRFLQYSGARFLEALSVRWQDVDFDRGHVTIGAEGESKNRRPRAVDLNPQLEAHLRDMAIRRCGDQAPVTPIRSTAVRVEDLGFPIVIGIGRGTPDLNVAVPDRTLEWGML